VIAFFLAHPGLAELPGKEISFTAVDWARQEFQKEFLAKNCNAETHLVLKVGCQVVCIKNHGGTGIVNGSQGVVIGFSQGQGGEGFADIDFSKHQAFMRRNNMDAKEEKFPIVKFRGVRSPHLMVPVIWEVDVNGVPQSRRTQVPLKLGYAYTIHRSQGMTLDKAEMHLARCFEAGQVYVALSRVRTLEGILIHSFDKSAVKADPVARKFNREMVKQRKEWDKQRKELEASGQGQMEPSPHSSSSLLAGAAPVDFSEYHYQAPRQ
jgi:ATP-dependent exoDNAse (exonuclease V) alpha subunit